MRSYLWGWGLKAGCSSKQEMSIRRKDRGSKNRQMGNIIAFRSKGMPPAEEHGFHQSAQKMKFKTNQAIYQDLLWSTTVSVKYIDYFDAPIFKLLL